MGKKKPRPVSPVKATLKVIESICQKYGLWYRAEHLSPDGTFARVRVSFDSGTSRSAIGAYESSLITGLIGVRLVETKPLIELQYVGGREPVRYVKVLMSLFEDLHAKGIAIKPWSRLTVKSEPTPAPKALDEFGKEIKEKQDAERKRTVARANKIKSEHPEMQWKEVAHEVGVPERTLREWRHNPRYK